MKENYTLYLSSQNSNNKIGTVKKSLQYYVNWYCVLPKADNINQKFLVKFKFVGYIQGSFGEIYSLSIDFGGSNMYDQINSKSNILGIMFPEDNAASLSLVSGTGSNQSYLCSDPNDNLPVTIEYPNNNFITVSINNINTGSGTTFTNDYNLILEFAPIY